MLDTTAHSVTQTQTGFTCQAVSR